MPGLCLLRPADANETAAAWRIALERAGGPTMLVLSRQNLPTLDRSSLAPADGVASYRSCTHSATLPPMSNRPRGPGAKLRTGAATAKPSS